MYSVFITTCWWCGVLWKSTGIVIKLSYSVLVGVYTCYKPFLSRDKTLLKRLVKVGIYAVVERFYILSFLCTVLIAL